MGVGQLSESDAVDALRLPFYSSSHPTGSHGWRIQFDLGNPDLSEVGVRLFMNNTAPRGGITSMVNSTLVFRVVVSRVFKFSSLISKISPCSKRSSESPKAATLIAVNWGVVVKFLTWSLSLILLEGQSDAGKSVLCQHFTHGALTARISMSYYTTENTVKSLVSQMSSLNLDITDFPVRQVAALPSGSNVSGGFR